jgi:Uma2 family endonuclease
VASQPNLPEGLAEKWLLKELERYAEEHPETVNFVYNKARVFVPNRVGLTVPEPDVAAYRDFPLELALTRLRWRDVSPILVGEVIAKDDPDKDLVRNVDLYLQVPSIREYWILDTRISAAEPTMYVLRRRGQRWQRTIEVHFGETYTTRLLPGFELRLVPG